MAAHGRGLKTGIAVIIIIAVAVSVSAYIYYNKITSTASSSVAKQSRIYVTDAIGRRVAVPVNVSRVVAVGPGCLRLLVYLNCTDKVVGVEDVEHKWSPNGRPYRMAHPELGRLPVIGTGGPHFMPNAEEIVRVKPQVIFATFMDASTADDLQEKTGIPVVVLSYGRSLIDLKPLYYSLLLAGKILGVEKRAREVVDFINNTINDLMRRTSNIPPSEKPTVYVGGIGYRGPHGITSSERKFPPFYWVHANNVVDSLGGEGHVFISKEALLKWNPDIIFIDEGGLANVLNDYAKDKSYYLSLKAFRTGRIYGILPYNFYATNIGTALADAYYIGKILYPSHFKDINPVEKANEIFEFLVGKPVYGELAKQWGGFRCLAPVFNIKAGGS